MLIAKSNLKHDGVLFEKGQEVTGLTESQARRLISEGIIEDTTIKATEEEVVRSEEAIEKETQEQLAAVKVNSKMSRNRLVGLARQRNLKFAENATKEELVKLLESTPEVAEDTVEDSIEVSNQPSEE